MGEPAQRLYSWLLRRSATSPERRMRAAGLMETAVKALQLDLVDTRSAFRSVRIQGLVEYAPDLAGLPFSGYLVVKLPQVVETRSMTAWRQALRAHEADPTLVSALLPAHEVFADLSDEDLALLVQGLLRVQGTAQQETTAFGFALSARNILGSSKILDRLPETARRLLGVAHLPSTPRYVIVAGPPNPAAVLLVENTTTYEQAVRAGLAEHVTLIAAYGYGLNMSSDSVAGWALVDSIGNGRCEVLSRTGHGHQLAALLQHPRLFFWGDLDREGLRIALALRAKLPQLRLSALYGPMSEMAASSSSSHPYSVACGKANQQSWRDVDDAVFDRIAAVCSTRAVDQEAVHLPDVVHLAAHGLTEFNPPSSVESRVQS